jgi:DNA polymerase
MIVAETRAAMLAALAWQIELGADEAIGECPIDRFADSAPDQAPKAVRGPGPHASAAAPERASGPFGPTRLGPAPRAGEGLGGGAVAQVVGAEDPLVLAKAAQTLEELAAAMRAWAGSPLRDSARNLVFSDGLAGARLMVIGEAPGGEEDRVGRPFVGRAGQLLDRMLAAIGLSRSAPAPETAVYITNILPWRPPGNRTPSEAEARQFLPFVERHIALATPDVILAVGNTPTKALLATSSGIKRMRGRWLRHGPTGLPVMPCFHPAYLLRTPEDKRLAWLDLLAVRRALDGEFPQ